MAEFSIMTFSDLPGTEIEERKAKIYDIPKRRFRDIGSKVIYNQDGYSQGIETLPNNGEFVSIGNPFVIKAGELIKNTSTPEGIQIAEDIPIGYNIFLPKGDIKGIMVDVYGGFQIKERIGRLKRPNGWDKLSEYLIDRGIAVISLNLIDLLKLDVPQDSMPDDLQTKLHASIHKFYHAT